MTIHRHAAWAKAIAFASLFLFACASAAQDITIPNEYGKVVKSAEAVGALGTDLFGDQTSFYTGSTEFTVTDVSLPGNNSIPVQLGRRYKVEDKTGVYGGVNTQPPVYQFGDWQLDIPHLHGVFARQLGWSTSYEPYTQRCLNINNPAAVAPRMMQVDGTLFAASEYWHGNHLYVPGSGDQEMLVVMPDNPHKPTDGGAYRWVTPQQWYFTCLPSMAANNGTPGDAFLALAPDGTRYWFDWAVSYPAPRITKPYGMDPFPSATEGDTESREAVPVTDTEISTRAYNSAVLQRDEVWIYPTRIQDRFGNWVTYTYDTTVKQRLTNITASDGRSLTLTYNTAGRVSSVTDGTRTWNYAYNADNTVLLSATLPDTSKWQYGLASLNLLHPADELAEPSCGGAPSNPTQTALSGSITHPSGAVGTFTFKPTLHGRSYVDRNCPGILTEDGAVFLAVHPDLYDSISIQSKRITGPGIPTYQWDFAYGPPNGSWLQDCGACADTKTVTVTGPGEWIRYTFSNRFQAGEGKLLKTETGPSANSILRTETATYWLEPVGQPYPDRIGVSPFTRSDRTSEKHAPLLQRQIMQQATTYTWLANGFDQFANPIKATRSSTPGGYTRTDITTFHHNLAKWVIGQVASSINTNTNLVESKTDYDANALPWKTWSFGKLQQTLAYNPDGTLKTVTDGKNQTTTFANWKRSTPQLITFADAKFKSAVVNNIGGVDSVTDENGFVTKYGYDLMGRLSLIDYPDADTVNWANTTRSFVKSGIAVYGLAAGHWEQTVATGTGRQITYFDALWRPMVQATYDTANTAGTLSQTVTRYDADGRPTFVSYPQRNQTAAVYNTWANPAVAPNALGTDTVYDALGRVTAVVQDSEAGPLATITGYLSNLDGPYTVVTNARSYQTRTWYQAYDQPNYDTPVEIWHPEATRTLIDRDVFGKPKTLTRRNDAGTVALNRYYYYDNVQQLCRTAEPESGSTVFAHDAANNLAWSAAGLAYPLATACYQAEASSSERRIDRAYDPRNRLKNLIFSDGRGSQTWTYTADGLTESIVTNNGGGDLVTNTYAYNKRRLLSGESLVWDVVDWPISYGYNANGHLASQNWHGLSIDYAPNALGQPTKAGTYATGVTYHPNGAMAQFTYGNGMMHTLSQNERSLPDVSCDFYGTCTGAAALRDVYDYDQNGNVLAILDGRAGNYSDREMTYDGLDRLKTAVSPMFGNAGYTYDVLDNLTRTTIGGTAARDHYFCYDAAWRLTNVKTGSCAGTSVMGLGYDVQGNLANKNGDTFVFDYGNRLRSSSVQASRYVYDGYGRRVLDETTAGDKYSQYTQAGQLAMTGDGRANTVSEYVYLNGSLLAIRERDVPTAVYTTQYQHTDALGSPVAVTDQNRVVIEKNEYEPYGKVINHPLKDGPGYTGHVADAATGLNYMQARYYWPERGGFLSVDPVTAYENPIGAFNRYWYANNNPYKFTDPDGRESMDLTLRGVEAIQSNQHNIDPEMASAALMLQAAVFAPAAVGYLRTALWARKNLSIDQAPKPPVPLKNRSGDIEATANAARTNPHPREVSGHANMRLQTRDKAVTPASMEAAAVSGQRTLDPVRGTTRHDLPATASPTGRGVTVVTTPGGRVVTVIDKGKKFEPPPKGP